VQAEPTAQFQERWDAAFGEPGPAFYVRAPGRINLIGEHTDYNGFPVLPIAIDRSIRILAAPRPDGTVELKNRQSSLYGDRRFELSESIPPYEPGDWGNYAKAAVQSLVQLANEWGLEPGELRGMSCLVDGDIPPSAGLASSTALVVASGLAFSAVNRLGVCRRAMADRMAEAEHYVGTQGGGMDQAVCLLAHRGEALLIEFFPLRVARVPFPRDACIVAAHSTVRASKVGQQRLAYNRRVLECNIAAHLLARELGVPAEGSPLRLADIAAAKPEAKPDELVATVDRLLEGRSSLSPRRAAALFATDFGKFARRFLRMRDGRLLPMPGDGLKVTQRCRHVFTEAARTRRAAECLRRGDLEELGRLMNQSHESCAADYEISCYELDELVEIMQEAGALGARLTGAGFGGFAIALARAEQADAIAESVRREFYEPRGLSGQGNVFVFRPAAGAVVERA